jgi:carboxyl-terminal processing protease
MKQIPKYKIYLPVIIAIAFVAGIWTSIALFSSNPKVFSLAVPPKDKIRTILDFVRNEYVDKIDTDSLIEKAIPEILHNLDPHSIYIPADEALAISEPLEGNFEGIGIQFNIQNDTIMVINTIGGGPSEKIGIRAGDRIVMINDSIVAGIGVKNSEVIKKLKGARGTFVKVTVKRKNRNELLSFNIKRDKIPIRSVDVAYMLNDKTAYLKISTFSRTTHSEFIDAVFKLKNSGMENMILDLRSNSGGYMDAATNIVDEFISGGKTIVFTKGNARPRKTFYSSDNRLSCLNTNIAVLIDEFSASASEIVAGAIQDNDRGWVMGRRSFGKGLVQESTVFGDGSVLRLTTARYYTPSGRCIQKPYAEGYESYYDDIINRFVNGEFMEADSIHFADSLTYYTASGRIVYGGGGIMPDVFVGIDTTEYTNLINIVLDYGISYSFAFKYTDNNREELSNLHSLGSIENYLDSINIMQEFYNYLIENKINFSYAEYNQSYETLRLQVYAYIGRNILDDKGFYPFINRIDNTIQKAIQILEDNKRPN